MSKILAILFILFVCNSTLKSQTVHQNTGWLFLMNSTKFNDKWGAHFDLQVRSSDEFQSVRNLLIRPGVTYFFNSSNNLTLGYLFTQTYTPGATPITENRAWEQFIHTHKIKSVNVSHRFRLEQRFIEKIAADDVFAQRLRYFVRFLIPLKRDAKVFEKGFFGAVQNEVFFNIQNKDVINNNLFDQNRAYLALGYRLQKKIDIEAGYMNQAVKGLSGHTNNNILQVAVYTRF
ncbi:MAG: DUF2490 domain-containing protein [Pedobacter sp.]